MTLGWSVVLALGEGDDAVLGEAREAVGHEVRREVRPTAWMVHEVEVHDADEGIYRLTVSSEEPLPSRGEAEGALIVRAVEDVEGPDAPGAWSATVLEVDADTDTVFVTSTDAPTPGRCRFRPVSFLRPLEKLLGPQTARALQRTLAGRLAAAAGERVARPVGGPPGLSPAWRHGWVLLWGPPGTGKTERIAVSVKALLEDPDERVLVLSTTNRAVDDVARRIATVLRRAGHSLKGLRRLGIVADPGAFTREGLDEVLPTRDPEVMDALREAEAALARATSPAARAEARRRLREVRAQIPTLSKVALDDRVRCAVTTLHAGVRALSTEAVMALLVEGRAPFTTVIVDEAGLVSRAHAAAASLWAARRVVLVGDPRQLAPIVTAARSMPRDVLHWLARSPLDHLTDDVSAPHVERLTIQHRMHPQIREAVSRYAYGGVLSDGNTVLERDWPGSGTLAALPRAIWYVLDAHAPDRPAATASESGPGGRSRVRRLGLEVLEALFAAQPELCGLRGLFVSPYRAQARAVRAWFAKAGLKGWRASTLHDQQGAEADVVIVDTVHASSSAWPPAEWKRLVNVGLSRARQLVILMCSRAEMRQPWLAPLARELVPRVLRERGNRRVWVTLTPWGDEEEAETDLFTAPLAARRPMAGPTAQRAPAAVPVDADPSDARLGAQIARRKRLRPVLSHEQARLIHRPLNDAGPRLVRGVAGSGKTLILAHWAVRVLRGLGVSRVTVVYGNQALRPLLLQMLVAAWEEETGDGASFPWGRVETHHAGALLRELLEEHGLPGPGEASDRHRYDYEKQGERLLAAMGEVEPRFDVLFVDEAQDLGHAPLELLVRLTRPRPDGRRPVMVFYDNAQNVFGRDKPTWARLGLDVRGRTDVMRESFRSTRPCVELALNVVDRLQPLHDDDDFRELMRQRHEGEPPLLRCRGEGTRRWWEAGFCDVDGEEPEVVLFDDHAAEEHFVADRVARWIVEEGVDPRDIVVIANGDGRPAMEGALRTRLDGIAKVRARTTEGFVERDGVVVTTAHSFKGHDAELVVVAGADRFVSTQVGVLVKPLWVALTRARTAMLVTAVREGGSLSRRVVAALEGAMAAREEEVRRAGAGTGRPSDGPVRARPARRRGELTTRRTRWSSREPRDRRARTDRRTRSRRADRRRARWRCLRRPCRWGCPWWPCRLWPRRRPCRR